MRCFRPATGREALAQLGAVPYLPDVDRINGRRMLDQPMPEKVLSRRVRQLRQATLDGRPRLSCERIRFLTQAYHEADGQPTVARRARLLGKLLRERTIFIDENPIVGTQTEFPLGAYPFPELSSGWMTQETRAATQMGGFELPDEGRRILSEAAEFWKDKSMQLRRNEIWQQMHPDVDVEAIGKVGVWKDNVFTPRARLNVDYGKVLNLGLGGIIEEATAELRRLQVGTIEGLRKRDFLNAVIETCQSVIAFARRYASLAEDMAQRETNDSRKQELQAIAQTCQWVPANPARTFREAIQSFWFTHLVVAIDHVAPGITPGRFPQYVYPFYKKDRDEGRIDDEEVIELLELLFIKFTQIVRYIPKHTFEHTQGSLFQNISLGGVTPDGDDATNELDFLILEAQERVRMPQPTLSVLYHSKLSQEFLLKAAEVVGTGLGMPAFFNHDLTVERLISHGASLEDAREQAIIGCVEAGFSHSCKPLLGMAMNMPKFLELALNNGQDPLTGIRVGPETGRAETFQSYDDLQRATREQLEYFVRLGCEDNNLINCILAEAFPLPFTSALVDDCIRNGTDINAGGARYHMDGNGPVGTIDLANSLAAIKMLVFEERAVSMTELLAALKADFHGYESLRLRLLQAPKYGNNLDYVDEIAAEWYRIFYEAHQKYSDNCGRTMRPWALSITFHGPFGAMVGALPDGRRAGLPLADGSVSACPGDDKEGLTALIQSAAKVVDCGKYACNLLNIKIHPTSLRGKDGVNNFLAMVRTYMELGGHHVQFNVVSAQTLRNAQAQPEDHRDLIVRVAGFSAFFVHLDRPIQDEIIARTELRLR